MRTQLLAGFLAVSLFTSGSAGADELSVHEDGALLDRGVHSRPGMVTLFAGLPYYRGMSDGFPAGLGLRYYVPVLNDGWISSANDEVGIDFGGDFDIFSHRDGTYYGVSLPVEALWAFHFHPRFDAYGKAGVGLSLGFGNFYGPTPAPFGLYPIGAAGFRFRMAETVFLRAEVGFPWAKVGLAFAF